MRAICLLGLTIALLPVAASAAETITYTYDAKGRLIRVDHSGSVNTNVATTYTYDAADNRTSKQVTLTP